MNKVRTFETGATRDEDTHKNDYEGFIDPLFIEAYGDYMTVHRVQPDGNLRDSDNWQRGMPLYVYIKSLWRHFLDLWKIHRGYKVFDKKDGHEITVAESCCAVFFNTQGYFRQWNKEHYMDDVFTDLTK